jgi:hypothetical protein
MAKKQHRVSWSAMVISAVLVASLLIFPSNLAPKAFGLPNQTSKNAGIQSAQNATSLGSPQSLMESVIKKTANTNATDFALKNLIKTTSGKDNTTAANNTAAANNTEMKTVLNATRNTNATNYGVHNVINATPPKSPIS